MCYNRLVKQMIGCMLRSEFEKRDTVKSEQVFPVMTSRYPTVEKEKERERERERDERKRTKEKVNAVQKRSAKRRTRMQEKRERKKFLGLPTTTQTPPSHFRFNIRYSQSSVESHIECLDAASTHSHIHTLTCCSLSLSLSFFRSLLVPAVLFSSRRSPLN